MIFSLKSALTAGIIYCLAAGFVHNHVKITVDNCIDGEHFYETHYYRYFPRGLEFLDDETGEVLIIDMNDEKATTFYLNDIF